MMMRRTARYRLVLSHKVWSVEWRQRGRWTALLSDADEADAFKYVQVLIWAHSVSRGRRRKRLLLELVTT